MKTRMGTTIASTIGPVTHDGFFTCQLDWEDGSPNDTRQIHISDIRTESGAERQRLDAALTAARGRKPPK